MKKCSAYVCVILLSFFFGASQGFACSCVSAPEPIEALEGSTSVFTGKVHTIEKNFFRDVRGEILGKPSGYDIGFILLESFKGENPREKIVHTSESSASCGYEFLEGEEYIVYTYGELGDESTSICSRTSSLQDASEDLRVLRDRKTTQNISPETQSGVLVSPKIPADSSPFSYDTSPGALSTLEHVFEVDTTLYFYIVGILILISGVWFMSSQKPIPKNKTH